MSDEGRHPIELFDDAATIVTGGIPTATVGRLLLGWWGKQKDVAQDELMRAFAGGEVDQQHLISNPHFQSILVKYAAAARDGAARKNIRLLAEAMNGLNRRKQLHTDEFERFADVLSRMTRDQMIFCGRYLSLLKIEMGGQLHTGALGDYDLGSRAAVEKAFGALRVELVPNVFSNDGAFRVVISQLAAFGLLLDDPFLESAVYEPSHLLLDISHLTDLEAAARVHS